MRAFSVFKFVLVFFPSPIFSTVIKSYLVSATPQFLTLSALLQSLPSPLQSPGGWQPDTAGANTVYCGLTLAMLSVFVCVLNIPVLTKLHLFFFFGFLLAHHYHGLTLAILHLCFFCTSNYCCVLTLATIVMFVFCIGRLSFGLRLSFVICYMLYVNSE